MKVNVEELVREQRFDELVREQRARIVGIVYATCGNWADAEEAVQEALIEMWTRRADLDQVGSLAGWLVTCARFKARELASQRMAKTGIPVGEDIARFEPQAVEPSTLPCAADPEVAERVRQALAAMSPGQREVVDLHCLQGMPIPEVARRLGTTGKVVSQRLYVALNVTDLSRGPWQSSSAAQGVDSPEAETFRSKPQLLKMLPPRTREAVRLRYIKRLPTAEVAARMNAKPQMVAWYVSSARKALRDLTAALQPV